MMANEGDRTSLSDWIDMQPERRAKGKADRRAEALCVDPCDNFKEFFARHESGANLPYHGRPWHPADTMPDAHVRVKRRNHTNFLQLR